MGTLTPALSHGKTFLDLAEARKSPLVREFFA